MKLLKNLYNGLNKVLDGIGILVAAVMFILLAYQIIIRILVRGSSPAANEIVTYSFIWLIYIGMVVAAKDRTHITVTMLADAFPPRIKNIFHLVASCVWLYFSVYVVLVSRDMIGKLMKMGSSTTVLHLPLWALNMILPICFAWGSIYIIRDIICYAKEIFKKAE